jgi:ribonuclease HII
MEEILETELFRLQKMSANEDRLRAKGFTRIAGIDEAGRGPLAGPVVAAACILPPGALFNHLNDSKLLSAAQRETLFSQITKTPNISFGIGIVDIETIDQINILQATFLAMRKAVEALKVAPDYLLIDGNQLPYFTIPTQAIVKGDSLSVSIAAASILAKVTRDRIMDDLDQKWPEYGFKRHKGYATAKHLAAIAEHGPSPIHRKSFDPVRSMLNPSPVQTDLFVH